MARELFRKMCAKCNITAAEDKNLSFHRFPLPGKHGISRIRVWAEYCYPDEDWSSEKSLKDLHFQHKMVCSKHFSDSCYTNSAHTRLNIFAVPSGAQDLLKDTKISVDIPQLDITENHMELVNHCDIKSVKKYSLAPNCSRLKQEAEMDIGETSIASTSISNIDTTTEIISKVSTDQTNILCHFFEENPEVIRGYKRTPKCMDKVQIKWKNITPHLNAVGPPRDHRSWAKDSHTSDLEKEDNNKYNYDLIKGENNEMDTLPVEVPEVKPKLEYLEQNSLVTNDTPPPDFQPHPLVFEDEFDYFGKNVAEQLRTLPLLVALETQEMLLSVLKNQRLKVLHDSDPLRHNE